MWKGYGLPRKFAPHIVGSSSIILDEFDDNIEKAYTSKDLCCR